MEPMSNAPTSHRLALITAGLIFLIYLPVALSSYMNHDDYVIFFEEDMYCGMLKCGRPVSAEILYGVLRKVVPFFPSLTFFSILRLVNAAAVATSAGLFFIWLNGITGKRAFTLALTVLFFTLPGFQVFASTAISASHLPVLPLVFLALLVLQWAGDPGGLRIIFSRRHVACAVLAGLLLLISFFAYQATTFLFMACAPLVFLCSPRPLVAHRGAFLQHAGIFAAAGAAHLLLGHFVVQPIATRTEADIRARHVHVPTPGAPVPFDFRAPNPNNPVRDFRFEGVNQVKQNLRAFVDFVSLRALNLWIVRDRFEFARCVAWLTAFSLLGILAWIYRQHPTQPMPKRVMIVLEGLVYLGISFAVANAVQLLYAPTPNYRVLLPYSALVLFLLCWPGFLVLSQLRRPLAHRLIGCVLAGGALVASMFAEWNTLQLFPDVQNAEYTTVRAATAPFVAGQVRTLEFTTRPHGNALVFGDEFSRLSSYSGRPVYGMVVRALAERQGRWDANLLEQLVATDWDFRGAGGSPQIVNTAAPATAGTLRVDLDEILSPLIDDSTAPVRLAQEGYRGFNILQLGRSYYAVPQGEGAFSLQRLKAGRYSTQFACRQGLPEIRAQIDAHVEANQKERPTSAPPRAD